MTRDNEVSERPDMPDAVKNRPPTLDQNVIERFELSPEWRISAWEKKGLTENCRDFKLMQISGGVYKHKYEKGPRKGRTDYRKPEPDTEVTVTLLRKDMDEWEARWEAETGYCKSCSGTGFAWHGWNSETGSRYRPCKRCEATGKAPMEKQNDAR